MKRMVAGYALALSVALVGAYQTWTHEGDPDLSGSTVILAGDKEDLVAVEYDSPTTNVRLAVREDELGAYVWVQATPKKDAVPEPAAAPDNPHGAPKKPVENGLPEAFKAGASGDQLTAGLAPFVAKRVLEGVDEAKLDELGFGEGQGALTITRKGREAKTYEVGAKAYGGSNRYVRDSADGTVYIVASNVLDPLETAKRSLPDRMLYGFDVTDIERVTIHGGEASATFVQNNPDDRAARFWAAEGSSEPNAAAAGWLDKALRLRVSRYVPEDERPAGLSEAFRYQLMAGRQALEITVLRAAGDDGEESWYAASPYNRGLVQLQRAAAAETQADLASVLDAGA